MIEELIHHLQRISSVWLALSVIYPYINNKIMAAAQRNNPVDYDRMTKPITQSVNLLYPACVTLILTIADVLL